MILIHVMRHWGDPATWTTPIGTVSLLPRRAAGGAGVRGPDGARPLAFSRRTTVTGLARRGVLLIAAGYLLNPCAAAPLVGGAGDGCRDAGRGRAVHAALATADGRHPPARGLLAHHDGPDARSRAGRSGLAPGGRRSCARGAAAAGRDERDPDRGCSPGPALGHRRQRLLPGLPVGRLPARRCRRWQRDRRARDRPMVLRRAGTIALAACVAGGALIMATSTTLDDRTYWRLPPILVPAILGFVVAWVWACDVAVRAAGQRSGSRSCTAGAPGSRRCMPSTG